MSATTTTWYHGTSSESGLDAGDWMNPRRGNFEPCVWATSSREAARMYAEQRAVLGGEPVVFEVVLADAVVVESSLDDVVETLRGTDADAVFVRDGEEGASMLAIRSANVARVRAIEAK